MKDALENHLKDIIPFGSLVQYHAITAKDQSSSVEETLQIIMEQTNNDCRFLISTLTSSLHQLRLFAGR